MRTCKEQLVASPACTKGGMLTVSLKFKLLAPANKAGKLRRMQAPPVLSGSCSASHFGLHQLHAVRERTHHRPELFGTIIFTSIFVSNTLSGGEMKGIGSETGEAQHQDGSGPAVHRAKQETWHGGQLVACAVALGY